MKKTPSAGRKTEFGDLKVRLLAFQTLAHERFALVTFFASGVRIAGFHFALLGAFGVGRRFGFGAQASFHKGFAFIAFFAFSLFVAGGHLALLWRFVCHRGRRGRRG
jgi:hypothetical protein